MGCYLTKTWQTAICNGENKSLKKIIKAKHTACRTEEGYCSATYNKGIDARSQDVFESKNERIDERLGYWYTMR
jgi:hypothetical protein